MKGEKGFDDAQGDMKEAEGDLSGGQGKPQGRADRQGRRGRRARPRAGSDARRRAGIAEADAARTGAGRNGKGGYVARRTRPGELPGDDPLGRGAQGDKGRDDGPLKGSVAAAERARRVMEELRRRLADPARPADERDYLERLMKRDSGGP